MKKFLLMLTLVPLMSLADTEVVDGIKWTYRIDGDTAEIGTGWSAAIPLSTIGSVTIPATLGGKPVTSISHRAFYGCSGLMLVTIPSSVTSIGQYAFSGCSGLMSETIPSSVTNIWDSAFSGCSGLTSITIPSSVTSIGYCMFAGCSGLTSITIPSSVTNIGWRAFYGCSGLMSVTLPSSVASMGVEMFRDCSGLTSVTIPPSVTSIDDGLFSGCSGLASVTIPSSVTSIGSSAFSGCSGLTSVTIPSNVTCIGNCAFEGCSGLKSVMIPSSVTNIGGFAFRDCSGLTSVTIPPSVTSIYQCAFSGCSGLKSMTIPSSVTNIWDSAFSGCSGLTSITIPSSVTSIGNEALRGCSGLTSITIPSSVTSIGWGAFLGCSGLTSVSIPSSVTRIGDRAFSGCESIRDVSVPGWKCGIDFGSVTNLLIAEGTRTIDDSAFYGSCGLASVTIPSSVASIGDSAFRDCKRLTLLMIPSGVTSIGNEAFSGCSGLASVAIPSSVASIGDSAFRDCKRLTLLMIPSGVTSIGDESFAGCSGLMSVTIRPGMTNIGRGAFLGCSGLTSVSIPSSIMHIGDRVFSGCDSIKDVEVPGWKCAINFEPVRNLLISEGSRVIDDSAFCGCSGLTSVTIPEGVTDIGDKAFFGCSGLTSVTIPEGATNIGDKAFFGCSGLTSVSIPSSVTSIGNEAFSSCCGLVAFDVAEENLFYKSVNGLLLSRNGGVLFASINGNVVIPPSVTSIGSSAFSGCNGLTSVTIPPSVTSIGDFAFRDCSGLTSVTIPSSVTYIGYCAFSNCDSIRDVSVPGWKCGIEFESVTNLVIAEGSREIHNFAFSGCRGLTSVTLPETLTEIGASAFSGCTNLRTAMIPPGVTNVGQYAFKDCASLTSVSIPSNVVSIGHGAFAGCMGVGPVTFAGKLPSADNGVGCNVLSNWFGAACSSITGVWVAGGTLLPAGFAAGCTNLTAVTLPAEMTEICASAFSGCTNLAEVSIPSGVTNIGQFVFKDCASLTSVLIPRTVVYIGHGAFAGCTSVGPVIFEGNLPAVDKFWWQFGGDSEQTLTIVGDGETPCEVRFLTPSGGEGYFYVDLDGRGVRKTYYGSSRIWRTLTFTPSAGSHMLRWRWERWRWGADKDIAIDGEVEISIGSVGPSVLNSWFGLACSSITSLTVRGGASLPSGFAVGCTSLTSITLPEVLTEIGASSFSECKSLTTVTIPETLTEIGVSAFSGCASLVAVTIPPGVTNIGQYAFKDCSSLTSVSIPSNVVSIGQGAFAGCTGVGPVTFAGKLPSADDGVGCNVLSTLFEAACSSITGVSVAEGTSLPVDFLVGCTNLSTVTVPEGVTKLPNGFFKDCESLTSVTLPLTLTDCGDNDLRGLAAQSGKEGLVVNGCCVIGYNGDAPSVLSIPEGVKGIAPWALSEQYDLEKIVLPSTLKTIGIGAFAGDTILQAVTIPDSVEKIDAQAFSGCSWLTEVAFGEGLREIGTEAFSGCTRIGAVELPGSLTSIGDNVFAGLVSLRTATVPSHLLPLRRLFPDSAGAIEEVVISDGSPSVCDEMFRYLTSLKRVTFAESVTNVGARAFQGCSAIGSLVLPGAVMSIGASAFRDCTSLTFVSLGPKVTSIGSAAFCNCRRLSWLTFPEGTTTVEDSVLNGCGALLSVGLPDGLSEIRASAFRSTSLTEVVLPSTVMNLGESVFAWGRFARVCYLGNAPTYDSNVYSGTSSELVSCLVAKTYGWDGIPKSRAPVTTWPTSNARPVEYTAQDLSRFAVSFDANGGFYDNGDGTTSSSRQMTETQGFRYVFPNDVPRRVGFTFMGWTTDASGGSDVTAGDVVRAAAEHTLYACWSPQFYVIRFDGNGGAGSMPDESFELGEVKALTANAFVRNGYRFVGWSRTAVDLVDFDDGATVSREILEHAGTVVLRAVWEPGAYNVRFDGNGGSGSMGDQMFTYGVAQALRCNDFRRSAYYFEGWSLSATGEAVYSDCETVSDMTVSDGATITLYAKWHPVMEISGTTVTVFGDTDMTLAQFTPDAARVTNLIISERVKSLPLGFFEGCERLETVSISDSLRAKLGYDDLWTAEKAKATYDANGFLMLRGWVLGCRDRQATRMTLPEGVVGIGARAFHGMPDLALVTLPASLRYIGKGAFDTDTLLDNLVIPDGVQEISEDAFKDCSFLQTLKMGRGVRVISDRAFSGCTQLSRFSAGISLETIGDCAFSNCWRMQSVSLPVGIQSVASTAFADCTELTGLVVPSGIAPLSDWFRPIYSQICNVTIPSGERNVCEAMFCGCSSLTTVEMPNGITNISSQAFKDCSRLVEMLIPQTVSAIGCEAFSGCSRLVSLVIPESVNILGESAIRNCSSLTDVTLSKNLTILPDCLFAGCVSLDSFTVPESVVYLGRGFIPSRTTAIYYTGDAPQCHGSAYESASERLTSYARQGTLGWDGRPTSRDMPAAWPMSGSYCRAISWWSPNQFDVTFDANGGVFAPVTAETYACEQITYTWYSLPPFEPTRMGYKFDGYWTEPLGGTRILTSTGVKLTKAHTLYAHWIKDSTITVRYNPNGGTVLPNTQNYTVGVPYGSFPVPTREHYVFTGWYTESIGGRLVVESSEVPGADSELFAHWTPCRYTIRFHANNGTSLTVDQSFVYGDNVTLRANKFTRSHSTFSGWSLSPDTSAVYADGKTLTDVADIEDGIVHLWACWTSDTYAVRFDSHGGEGVMPNQTFTIGVAQLLTKNVFTRKDFRFIGWSCSTSGAVVYSDGELVKDLTTTRDATVVLYAVWAAVMPTPTPTPTPPPAPAPMPTPMPTPESSVVVFPDGSQIAGSVGETICLLGELQKPGFVLIGWQIDGKTYLPGAQYVMTASAVVAEAIYEPNILFGESVIDSSAGETAPYVVTATVYDGYCVDEAGVVKGTVQVKVAKGKLDKQSGSLAAKVTATVQMVDGSKKLSFKNGIADETGAVTSMSVNGHTLDVTLGAYGLGGTFDGKYRIDGASNVFAAKDAESKAIAAAVEKQWVGAVNVVGDGVALAVSIAKKGKVTVAGTVNGAKVSATSQLLVGEEACCVPVVITKKANLAFNLWLMDDGSIELAGLEGVVAGKAGTLKSGAAFCITDGGAAVVRSLPGLLDEYLPDGLSVSQSGTKWAVAGGAKAGKIVLMKGSTEVDEAKSKFTDNMSGLKITYKSKDGSFTGSFKAYAVEKGKLKAYTLNVTGVMIGSVGYGTATLKKPAVSFPVTIE